MICEFLNINKKETLISTHRNRNSVNSQMPAPRRALSNCRKRSLTEDECAPIIEALTVIKKKKAETVLALTKTALDALFKLEDIEEEIDTEARKVHEDYVNVIKDYKVTFRSDYLEHEEELDDPPANLEDARFVVQEMNKNASDTLVEMKKAEEKVVGDE